MKRASIIIWSIVGLAVLFAPGDVDKAVYGLTWFVLMYNLITA